MNRVGASPTVISFGPHRTHSGLSPASLTNVLARHLMHVLAPPNSRVIESFEHLTHSSFKSPNPGLHTHLSKKDIVRACLGHGEHFVSAPPSHSEPGGHQRHFLLFALKRCSALQPSQLDVLVTCFSSYGQLLCWHPFACCGFTRSCPGSHPVSSTTQEALVFSSPMAARDPVEHFWQLVCLRRLNVPFGHGLHSDWPGRSVKNPRSQSIQTGFRMNSSRENPRNVGIRENVRGRHSRHSPVGKFSLPSSKRHAAPS